MKALGGVEVHAVAELVLLDAFSLILGGFLGNFSASELLALVFVETRNLQKYASAQTEFGVGLWNNVVDVLFS